MRKLKISVMWLYQLCFTLKLSQFLIEKIDLYLSQQSVSILK